MLYTLCICRTAVPGAPKRHIRETYKRQICKGDLQKKLIKETYKSDLQKSPDDALHPLHFQDLAAYMFIYSYVKRPTKETYKRVLQKRPTKEP